MSKPIIEPLRLGRRKKKLIAAKPKEREPCDMASVLYEIMIGEATERFYINDAPKPAWVILGKYSMLSSTRSSYELWFSTMHRWRLRTLKECHAKIKEMVSKAKVSMKVWRDRRLRSGKRELFAEKLCEVPCGGESNDI